MSTLPREADFSFSNGQLGGRIGEISETTNYGFFAFQISGQRGPLRDKLRELSTDTDVASEDASRTYRFSWLIDHLARFDFAREVPTGSFYLTVRYR